MTMRIVIIVAALVAFGLVFLRGGGGRAEATDVHRLVDEGALLLDVRTPAEYQAGHLPEARNVPVQALQSRLAELGDKDRDIVVYCRSGARSSRAASMLRSAGFASVHDLGPMSAW